MRCSTIGGRSKASSTILVTPFSSMISYVPPASFTIARGERGAFVIAVWLPGTCVTPPPPAPPAPKECPTGTGYVDDCDGHPIVRGISYSPDCKILTIGRFPVLSPSLS